MVADDARLYLVGERPQAPEMIGIEPIAAGDRQADAVQDERVVGAQPQQHLPRPPADGHEVLGDQLEPIDAWPRVEEIAEVARPEAEAEHGGEGATRSPAGRNAAMALRPARSTS